MLESNNTRGTTIKQVLCNFYEAKAAASVTLFYVQKLKFLQIKFCIKFYFFLCCIKLKNSCIL